MAFRALFEQTKPKTDESFDESSDSSSDEDFARYPAPLNDLYEGSCSPGAEGNERGTYDRTARYLRGFYNPDSDDNFFITDNEKEENLRLPQQTPKGQGTLRCYRARLRSCRARDRRKRAEEILYQNRKTKNYPELTKDQFAMVQTERRLLRQIQKRLNRKQRSGKKKGSPYSVPPYEISCKTPRRNKRQLRL